jgi:hypothetical protein
MEAAVVGSGGNGILAAAINTDGGMVAGTSTAAAQLTMTTTIFATTIDQRCHHYECN